LNLGDQRVFAGGQARIDGPGEAPRGGLGLCFALYDGQRAGALRRRDLIAFVGADAFEHVHDQRLDTSTSFSRRFIAAPVSSDCAASLAPSLMSFALPATISAAAAFRTATSRNGPGFPA